TKAELAAISTAPVTDGRGGAPARAPPLPMIDAELASRRGREIFLSHLPGATTEADIRTFVAQADVRLQEIRIIRNPRADARYCFCTFATTADAARALHALQGKHLFDHAVQVAPARCQDQEPVAPQPHPERPRLTRAEAAIILGNRPFGASQLARRSRCLSRLRLGHDRSRPPPLDGRLLHPSMDSSYMAVHARYLLDKPFVRTVFRRVAWRQDPIWGLCVKSVLYAGYPHPPGYPPTLDRPPRKVMERRPALVMPMTKSTTGSVAMRASAAIRNLSLYSACFACLLLLLAFSVSYWATRYVRGVQRVSCESI